MRTYLYEFHGDRHDGLRMLNLGFHEAVALPLDIPINNPDDYRAWVPTEGQRVGIYARKETAVERPDETGQAVNHLYLHHTEVLSKAPFQ
ncbi:hypothetical protein PBI_MORRISSEY_48 [Gordonia phage Morrissey]|nr:hypothetical protein PBI_MORRISSEY_48 [Gordonia phage Morrissey]